MLLTTLRLEESRCIQIGIANELVKSPVKTIRAACRCHVDRRARRPTVLRALVVRHHVELRHRIRRDGDDLVVESLVALAVGVVVHAVEQIVVEHAALAVDVVRALAHQAADRAGRRRRGRLARTGHQRQQIGEVAAHQRQRLGLVAGNRLSALAGLRFHLQSHVAHFDVVALAWPTFSVKSMRARPPTAIEIFVASTGANPCASARMLYVPTRNDGTL